MTHGQVIHLEAAGGLVLDLVEVIHQNRQRLSAIDGAIGDGDHGVNMDKGFSQCGAKLAALPALPGLPQAFEMLALTLMDDIGGSMGPLSGSFFLAWSEAAVAEMGGAQVGDKTLMDTLVPARDAYADALAEGRTFSHALGAMVLAAEAGMESTRALQARIGRAARLGERSIGVLDAGATSCFLILHCIGQATESRLQGQPA
jgi:phosphoenolpyruvate---glycerone phosphotransferase subunit DhaL